MQLIYNNSCIKSCIRITKIAKLKKKEKTMTALNGLFAEYILKEIKQVYILQHNSELENNVVLLTI